MAKDEKEPKPILVLPEGRLINQALFVRDQYNDQSKPSYKVEIAFDEADLEEAGVFDALADAVAEEFGDAVADEGTYIDPILDGDELAAKRAAKDKPGDAYEGKLVIRAATIYNLNGIEGEGGIQVFQPNGEPLEAAAQGEIYGGCYGKAAVRIGVYTDSRTQEPGAKFFLCAFQKTKDGEKLATGGDYSNLFKPVGRDKGKGSSRRSRKG